jgi:hypothetical protein
MRERKALGDNPLSVPAARAARSYMAADEVQLPDAERAVVTTCHDLNARPEPEESYCHPALQRATDAVVQSRRQTTRTWHEAARGELWTIDWEDFVDLHDVLESLEVSDDGSSGDEVESEEGELEAADMASVKRALTEIYQEHRPQIDEKKLARLIESSGAEVLLQIAT